MVDAPDAKAVALGLISAGMSELTLRQLAVFLIISTEQGPHRVRHMAARIATHRVAVVRATTKLVTLGWITRHRDTHDARDVLFTTTKAGANALAKMRAMA